MCGLAYDDLQVAQTRQYLKDIAATWYRTKVEDSDIPWTFENMVCELFKAFVHSSSSQRAKTAFDSIKYNSKDCALGYLLELQLKAGKLVVAPDEYTM